MSHFANADELADSTTRQQVRRFAASGEGLGVQRSFCNSAGVLAWPQAHAEWVRPGVMLYGVSPMTGRSGPDEDLRPAMTLRTGLIAVKEVRRGERVGYSGTWEAMADTRIGIAAIGYGDGYPRNAPSGTPVLVNDRPAGLAGRVSMDMLAIDLGGQPQARVGDPVVLWGYGLPVERIAAQAGTIAYELLCGVTSRVHVELQG
jgi:alanine racemase